MTLVGLMHCYKVFLRISSDNKGIWRRVSYKAVQVCSKIGPLFDLLIVDRYEAVEIYWLPSQHAKFSFIYPNNNVDNNLIHVTQAIHLPSNILCFSFFLLSFLGVVRFSKS